MINVNESGKYSSFNNHEHCASRDQPGKVELDECATAAATEHASANAPAPVGATAAVRASWDTGTIAAALSLIFGVPLHPFFVLMVAPKSHLSTSRIVC